MWENTSEADAHTRCCHFVVLDYPNTMLRPFDFYIRFSFQYFYATSHLLFRKKNRPWRGFFPTYSGYQLSNLQRTLSTSPAPCWTTLFPFSSVHLHFESIYCETFCKSGIRQAPGLRRPPAIALYHLLLHSGKRFPVTKYKSMERETFSCVLFL